MRPTPIILTAIYAACIFGAPSFAEELKEMQLAEVPEAEQKPVVVLDPDEAVLVVLSPISGLSFDSNIGIVSVDQPNPGEYWVHLPPGTNMVTFKAEGYMFLKERFYIDRKQSKQVKVTPKAAPATAEGFGGLKISTEPAGANIELDGLRMAELTPYENIHLQAGTHSLKLTPDDEYLPVDTMITVIKERTTEFSVKFTRKTGNISIRVNPPEAEIYINGQLLKGASRNLENYPTGTYIIEARMPGKVPVKQEVKVRQNQTARVDVELTKAENELPVTKKSIGKPKSSEPLERWITGLKAGASLAQFSGGGEDQRMRDGFCGSIFIALNLSKVLALQQEVFYSRKGGENIANSLHDIHQSYEINYLEFPLSLRINLLNPQAPVNPFLDVGAYWAVWLDDKYKYEWTYHGSGGDLFESGNGKLGVEHFVDYGTVISGGLGFRIGRGQLFAELRYEKGLAENDLWIIENYDDFKAQTGPNHGMNDINVTNNLFALLIGYSF